jgi:SAM-dependent methyltransferase
LAERVPRHGLVVDLGCGHGVFDLALALESPGRRIVGVDPALHKVSLARSATRAGMAVRFLQGDARANPVPGPCQAILLLDVLYLLDRQEQARILHDCYARLVPGGTLLIKTMDDRPRWKAALNRAEEWMAVRLLGLTLADHASFTFRPLDEWAALCGTIGFEVETARLDRGYYHPHAAVIGVRP